MPWQQIVITREDVVAAFDEWQRRYEADPEAFNTGDPGKTYGEDCADYLVELIAETLPSTTSPSNQED